MDKQARVVKLLKQMEFAIGDLNIQIMVAAIVLPNMSKT